MRTYVRVERGHDPARGRRLVLRVRRAAGRSAPAGQAGDRGRLGGAGGELRGQGRGRENGDECRRGTPSLSRGHRRAAADAGVLGGEQGDVRRLRGRIAARRAALDRRGVPRRARDAAAGGIAHGHGHPAAPRRARTRRPADHRRSGAHQVPREGGQRRREARRPARRRAPPRARVSPPARGRAALGGRAGDGPKAARGQAAHSRRCRRAQRGDAGRPARSRIGPAALRPVAEPRRAAGAAWSPPRLDRAQRALGRSSTSPEALDATLVALVDRITRRMRAARRVGRTVVLRLRFGDFARATRSHTLPRSTAQTLAILATARARSRPLSPRSRREA